MCTEDRSGQGHKGQGESFKATAHRVPSTCRAARCAVLNKHRDTHKKEH